MKFPDFDYVSPTSLDEVLAILAERGDGAMVLAGGQSLMPVLAFRLAAPEILVDLKNVPALDGIEVSANGVRLGARVRWRDIEKDVVLAAAHPLLVEAAAHISHYQVRNRGTVGGSLALADPSAELPGIAVACDGMIEIAGSGGRRTEDAKDFFEGAMATALRPGEVITGLILPPWPKGRRWGFREFSRRRGDFAMAGVAVFFDLDDDGLAVGAHVGVIGASDRPVRVRAAEVLVDGTQVDDAAAQAAAVAASVAVDPIDDFHAPSDYRRGLVKTLTERALREATLR
ncbi:MAG: FAD binding domain-containing protein [Pseudomonadota bacterium]|nr:FAD binding domain-containing protein [Pseudomonadota bacterium]